jgi:hypothetical protein
MRFVARFFCIVFTIVVINLLIDGGYKYHTMGSEYFVSVTSNPLKYYFALVWQSLIVCVSFYFGFIVKLETNNGEKTPNKKINKD